MRTQINRQSLVSRIAAATGAATRYTGWIACQDVSRIALEIAFTYNAATAVLMTAKTTDDPTTANGSGFSVVTLSDSGTVGTYTSTAMQWSQAIAAANLSWTWTLTDLPHLFVNCAFTFTSGGASDLLTVKSRGLYP